MEKWRYLIINMRGYCSIGIYEPKTGENIGTLWRSAFLLGADFIFTIGKRYKKQVTDTPNTQLHIPLFEYSDLDDFRTHIPYDSEIICVEMTQEAQSLIEFTHPERAVYLLGSEDKGIPKELLKDNKVIEIPYGYPFSLNVSVTGSIILYDRLLKGGEKHE